MANYVIRPDHRRGPTALQLLAMFRQPRFSACVAFGINPATSAIYRVLRGEVLPLIPRHFVVLPGGAERMRDLLDIAHPDWEGERARSLADAFSLAGISDEHDRLRRRYSRRLGPRGLAGTGRLHHWARRATATTWSGATCAIRRFEYRPIAAPEGGRTGLAVWRLETIRRQTPEGRRDVDRIARLVEFLPVSRANARALFTAFLQQACAAGAFGADYLRLPRPIPRAARRVGVPPHRTAPRRRRPALAFSAARRQGRRHYERHVSGRPRRALLRRRGLPVVLD